PEDRLDPGGIALIDPREALVEVGEGEVAELVREHPIVAQIRLPGFHAERDADQAAVPGAAGPDAAAAGRRQLEAQLRDREVTEIVGDALAAAADPGQDLVAG